MKTTRLNDRAPEGVVPRRPMNVDIVVLRATTQERKNVLVSGLNQDNFQIYEDGAFQSIKCFNHAGRPGHGRPSRRQQWERATEAA